jgi:hypothetical protein
MLAVADAVVDVDAAGGLGAAAGDATIRLCAMNLCPSRTARVPNIAGRL